MNLNISYNWIKEYVKINLTAFEFAKKISLHGPSVDRIHELKADFEKVIIGQIKEISKHPSADKLQVCKVDVVGKDNLNIVCGAPNIKEGQKVPVVLVGGRVGEMEIKPVKIRGVDSEGMMCSQKELGIGDDHSGIFILPDDVKIGLPLEKVILLNDSILDIEITSNRPDAMCAIGIAREASAIFGEKFLYKDSKINLSVIGKELPLQVKVKESKICPRYQAIVIDDVQVGSSPMWMQQRLMASGIRPINNLVDITNYVLLEYGQPMHVFDYEKINGKEINVRYAQKGEKILALDGNEYELSEENLVIADAKNPVAVGGVMGGDLSAASKNTKTIVFECANFNSLSVRKTARALNLHSESSDLYEKSLSPENTTPALLRAIELVQKIADGKVASKIIDVNFSKFENRKEKLNPIHVNNLLGIEIKLPKMKNILQSLGFEVAGSSKELVIKIPWWRDEDIEGEHDLIEEIARIYGYMDLPSKIMDGEIPISYQLHDEFFWESKVKNILAGIGYDENYNYSFVSSKLLKDCLLDPSKCVNINNPLSSDFEYMRPVLLPSLMQSYSENAASFEEVKIFELSATYISKGDNLPDEKYKLALLCAMGADDKSFSELKGALELLMSRLYIDSWKLVSEKSLTYWKEGAGIKILIGDDEIGKMGLINPTVKAKIGIKKAFAALEIDFDLLVKYCKTNPTYRPLPKFPSIELDLSMEIGREILFDKVLETVISIDPLIKNVSFLSLYEGENISPDKKALAIRIKYQHNDKTLELTEAQVVHDKVVQTLNKLYNIKVR